MEHLHQEKPSTIARLKSKNNEELIDIFNKEVTNNGWGNARCYFLVALQNEIYSRNFDCTIIINNTGMSLKKKVQLVNSKLKFVE